MTWSNRPCCTGVSGACSHLRDFLAHVSFVKIGAKGILIEGVEVVLRGMGIKNIKADYYPQAWWCVPRLVRRAPRPAGHRIEAKFEEP
ncbi:hypothetical protein VAR608DRAFT_4888 [Variovorax sp. HW608]|nr:hypothetical protein VAR608DRAFT_4888 [Variovorax sp. HW608]